jgi:hypothetical protein
MHTLKTGLLCILTFVSSQASYSHELIVTNGRLKYNLSAEAGFIRYKTQETSLSLEKRSCNGHIIDKFLRDLTRYMKGQLLHDQRGEFLVVKFDNDLGYVPKFGARAVFLVSMNERIKKLKIEEMLNCEK